MGDTDILSPDHSLSQVDSYHPAIVSGEWYLSAIDLTWIAEGCAVLGVGGVRGSTYYPLLSCLALMGAGHTIRVKDVDDFPPDAPIIRGGDVSSPLVSIERLRGEQEAEHVIRALF